jgi:hypothetical protein
MEMLMRKLLLGLLFCSSFLLAQTIRIMPLGDSITYDNRYSDEENPRPSSKRSGYRNYLWYMLEDANLSVDFVGSRVAGEAIQPPFDPDNEGWPGWTSFELAEKTYDFMVQSDPDVVLLHAGTNDRTTTNPEGVIDILDEIDAYELNTGHHIQVFVALIIDRKEYDWRIDHYNKRLLPLLQKRQALGDDIVIVDMYHNARLTSKDYADNTHPNNNGYYKMARVWYQAIINNPYNPETPSYTPLGIYPRLIGVTEDLIIEKEYDGDTLTFSFKLPANGVEIK